MKKCELCDSVAKMYCESDQASLCWECDIKVHGANFLVAKHSRTLLCHVCQSPTPWNGSGLKLCPTVSVCENCADHGSNSISVGRSRSLLRNSEILTDISSQELTTNAGNDEPEEEDEDEDEDGGNDTDEDHDEDESGGNDTEEDHDEDDEENQVVPWSCSEECHSESLSKSNRNSRQQQV